MKASIGDFIIKGVSCEFYPCKPEVFYQTYEEVVDMWNTRTPEIVRCGECEHYIGDDISGQCGIATPGEWNEKPIWYPQDFCSYGERREEE